MAESKQTLIGIDTGGTFTDFVRWRDGELTVHKCRSTPDDPARAIVEGLQFFAQDPALTIVHGSTVATNAVLERKGARVALVATAGFEDVLTIGRQTRPQLYNLFVPPRRPIVEPGLVFGLLERLDATGAVIEPVDESTLEQLAGRLTDRSRVQTQRGQPSQGVEVVAVCLLHSYANPAHERQVAERLRRAGLRVCASHEVLPEYREFERWSTTVLNAYVTPLIEQYLGNLQRQLGSCTLRVMQSNGGSISAAAASAQPVRTVLSGPAGGVVGASYVARAAGFSKIISFDMGGTSTDVSLVDRNIATTTESIVGDFPVRLPILDIHTVGAGGGSIAALDAGGALRVGPQSAGADPGPASYGIGQQLTVTDANLLLGRIDPDYFLGGRMALQPQRALDLARDMAARMKLSVQELAEGIIRVANANMERALRTVSIGRGHDPREFALVAFGGAGGIHACELAAQLDIGTVLVPRHAGVLSALGMLLSDVVKDYSVAVLRPSDSLGFAELKKRFSPLVSEARRSLAAEGFKASRQVIERLVDVRYIGQSYEITLPFARDYQLQFHRRHAQFYGYSNPRKATELVNIRVKASGITNKPDFPVALSRPTDAKRTAIRSSWFDGRKRATAFYIWDHLKPGACATGPAVLTGGEATIVIPPRFRFRVDGMNNVIIRRK